MTLTMGRIRAEDLHEEAASGDFFDGPLDPLFFNVSLDIHKEDIFPGLPSGWAGFDLRHAQPVSYNFV